LSDLCDSRASVTVKRWRTVREEPSSDELLAANLNESSGRAESNRIDEDAVELGSASAQQSKRTSSAPDQAGDERIVRPLKQIDVAVLNVGYAKAGPASGPVEILLHGWPYDIHSDVDVAPLWASSGC
jgi:hypothetical protein